MKKLTEDLKVIITSMMDQINMLKSLPDNKDFPNSQDNTTVVMANKQDPSLEGGSSTKLGVMWTLKHEIISPKLYELFINTELKGKTALDLKNLYKRSNMCLDAVTRLREEVLHAY